MFLENQDFNGTFARLDGSVGDTVTKKYVPVLKVFGILVFRYENTARPCRFLGPAQEQLHESPAPEERAEEEVHRVHGGAPGAGPRGRGRAVCTDAGRWGRLERGGAERTAIEWQQWNGMAASRDGLLGAAEAREARRRADPRPRPGTKNDPRIRARKS